MEVGALSMRIRLSTKLRAPRRPAVNRQSSLSADFVGLQALRATQIPSSAVANAAEASGTFTSAA